MRGWALPLLVIALAGAAPVDLVPHKAAHHAKAKAPKPTAPDQETEHVVGPGETLGGIAARAKIPRVLIAEANGIKPPYAVHEGQRLLLPRTRHHKVKAGETGFDIAIGYGVPFSSIAVANGLKSDAVLRPGQNLLIPTVLSAKPAVDSEDKPAKPAAAPDFIWPLAGKVLRAYAPRSAHNYHDGIDIAAPAGSAVRAAAAGKVIFAGEEPQSFGRLVVIDHGGGWQSAYGFLGKLTVKLGDAVKARERVGLVGHSGKAPRDELHFELRKANQPTDPAEQLPEAAKAKN